jgi:hypothetical protein
VVREGCAGSSPAERTQALCTASLAQSAAQPPCKRKVPGSGPGGGSSHFHAFVAPVARARSWYERGPGFKSRRRLPVTVVSAVQHSSTPCSQGRFKSGRSLACRPSPIGRGAGLRNLAVGVRVPGTVLTESEPARGRASPLTTARFTPWCSSHPLSSEDEPARRLAPAGNRAAAGTSWASTAPSSAISRPFASGGRADMESEPIRDRDRFEGGSAFARCGSSPPLSSKEGAPPARQRVLNTRAG